MRVLRVVAAVIWREGADGREVFATQRGYMDCFWCKLLGGYELKEHSAAKWLKQHELNSINWLPADLSLIER